MSPNKPSFPFHSPTLLLDADRCQRNLRRMQEKALHLGLELVPHFKTAQSRRVAQWFKATGGKKITVSSLHLARYLAKENWDMLHIAFPLSPALLPEIQALASECPLSVQVVNEAFIQACVAQLQVPLAFWIEIDAGYGRAGIFHDDIERIERVLALSATCPYLRFEGFYIHPGHTYKGDVDVIYEETLSALAELKNHFKGSHPQLKTRVADTPGASMRSDFGTVDSIGPGNYQFYDLTQVAIGSCQREDIAIALVCPIVDIRTERGEVLVHGGGVHLSKDVLNTPTGSSYGEVVQLSADGHWTLFAEGQAPYVKSISQEHGLIQGSPEWCRSLQVGQPIGILPVHSCMTADCMRGYRLVGSLAPIDHAEGYAIS
ncbi:alanine racemase [Nitritalea halalkaliphila LW7]|uniref:Alanine racemase n=1 Tax=Nitritalea halalkaliphila LW7 TaxID=1189621 RepID=I5C4L5_9BACT|nr:alanine racemase [Nitritalea halalkaliphila]EIM76767.1 alanine racemase [Nitritalea halalkaliphila LW7]